MCRIFGSSTNITLFKLIIFGLKFYKMQLIWKSIAYLFDMVQLNTKIYSFLFLVEWQAAERHNPWVL